MRKLFALLLFCASASMPTKSNAASPAATQAWVRRYIETNALSLAASTRSATSNNVVTASAGEGEDQVIVRVEEFSDAALFVTNSQTAAVTDGTRFVWNGNGAYICAAGTIVSTRTNLVWGGVGSHFTNGVIRFEGEFDCRPILIQQSTSFAITNGLAAAWGDVRPKWYERVADVLAELIVPSACAAVPSRAEDWYWPDEGYDNDVGAHLHAEFWDAKAKMYVPVDIAVSTDGNKNHYVSKEAIESAFSGLTANINTALFAVGAALDGIVQVSDDIAWNTAAIKKIGENLFNHAAVDLDFDKDGNLTWKVAGGSGSVKKYSQPQYTVLVDDNGFFALYKDGTKVEPISDWLSGEGDGKSIGKTDEQKNSRVQIHGWAGATPGTLYKLSDILAGKYSAEESDHIITRSSDGTLNYTQIGKLEIPTAAVDGTTIVTNADGHAGEMALAGFWDEAQQSSIPYCDGESLKWTSTPTKGSILAGSEDLGIKWTSSQSKNHYYGTPQDGTDLGWWELPNVTTNSVQGDEKTITVKDSLAGDDPEIKRLGLKEYPGAMDDDGLPYGAYMDSEGIHWAKVPLPPTNETASVTVDGVSVDTNGTNGAIQLAGFKDDMGDGYIVRENGKVGSRYFLATNGLYRTEDGSGKNRRSTIGLEDWENPSSTCVEKLGSILTGETMEGEDEHLVLTRKNDGTMHYMQIGSIESTGSAIKFVGTEGEAVVGSGPTTNTVTFAKFSGSNIRIKVESSGGNATITFGVYYQ